MASAAYGSTSLETTGRPAKREPATVAAIIDEGGFGRFQFQLLGMLGLAWIADSMEVMIVRQQACVG